MMRRRVLAAIRLVAVLALPAAVMAGGPPLSVCLLADNLPYSERSGETGFDVDVARAVAREQATALRLVWSNNSTRITEIDDSDFPLVQLARGDCDALFSVPGPAATTLQGHSGIVLGEPYYGAAFELIDCRDSSDLDFDNLRGRRIAIRSQTVAHFAVLKLGAEPQNHFAPGAAIAAAATGAADAALLWGPGAGWWLRHARSAGLALREPQYAACRLLPRTPPRALRWNLHVATRATEPATGKTVDSMLRRLRESGELGKLMQRYGMRAHAPFATTYSDGAIEELGSGR